MQDEKTPALFTHLSALSQLVGIPFGNIVGPLVLWLIFRERSDYVNHHGKEAVNFNISFMIYFAVAGILCFVIIGLLLLPVLVVVWIVFVIIATVKASNGEGYRYPFTIRFIK